MAIKNPNKAVLTIDKSTKKILVANDMAGELFGVPTENLVGASITSLLDPAKMRSRGAEAVGESLVDVSNGDMLTLSGKVIDVVHAATGIIDGLGAHAHRPGPRQPRCGFTPM